MFYGIINGFKPQSTQTQNISKCVLLFCNNVAWTWPEPGRNIFPVIWSDSKTNKYLCWLTQLLHQPLHIYKIYKILYIKTLKTLRHVSVLRPSSGSYIFLAKVTLEIVTYQFPCTSSVLLYQPLHIYKIYKILYIKTLKTLRHVSVLRPSWGSYIFLAKVTLEIVTY